MGLASGPLALCELDTFMQESIAQVVVYQRPKTTNKRE